MTEWNTLSGRCPECFCTPHADGCQIGEMEQRIKELEVMCRDLAYAEQEAQARLDAVERLPEKWREEENSVGGYMAANNGYTCANELEAALGQKDAT